MRAPPPHTYARIPDVGVVSLGTCSHPTHPLIKDKIAFDLHDLRPLGQQEMMECDSTQDVDEVTFVEEPLDFYHECLVCLQLLKEPWILECCGHHLCIDKLIRNKQRCPHCRIGRFRYMRDRNHERILLGKQVYCKYKSKGCEWKGTLREVDQHCSAKLRRCDWCQNHLQCYEENQHQGVCIVANEVIDCELKPFACSEKLPRMNIHRHMQDHCKEHIELVKQAYEKLSSEVCVLAKKIEKGRVQVIKETEAEIKKNEGSL